MKNIKTKLDAVISKIIEIMPGIKSLDDTRKITLEDIMIALNKCAVGTYYFEDDGCVHVEEYNDTSRIEYLQVQWKLNLPLFKQELSMIEWLFNALKCDEPDYERDDSGS